MTFTATVDGKELKAAMARIKKAKGNTALPITAMTHVVAHDEGLTLTATDLDQCLSIEIDAYLEGGGSAVLDTAGLIGIAGPGTVTLTVDPEGSRASGATATRGAVTIPLTQLPAKDFPTIPTLEGFNRVAAVNGEVLKAALDRVTGYTATDDTRPMLTGVNIIVKENAIELGATDGFRMRVIEIPAQSTGPYSFTVPSKCLKTWAQSAGKGEVGIYRHPTKNQAVLTTGDVQLVTKLIEGSYPNLKGLYPAKTTATWLLDTTELKAFLATAKSMKCDCIGIRPNAEGFLLEATSTDSFGAQTISAQIAGMSDGDTLGIAQFKVRFVVDALTEREPTEVRLSGPNSAAVWNDDAVIMPMHLPRDYRREVERVPAESAA